MRVCRDWGRVGGGRLGADSLPKHWESLFVHPWWGGRGCPRRSLFSHLGSLPLSSLSLRFVFVVGGAALPLWAPHGFHAGSRTPRLGPGPRGCHRRRAHTPDGRAGGLLARVLRCRRPCRSAARTPGTAGMGSPRTAGRSPRVVAVALHVVLPSVGVRRLGPPPSLSLSLSGEPGFFLAAGAPTTQWNSTCVLPPSIVAGSTGCRPSRGSSPAAVREARAASVRWPRGPARSRGARARGLGFASAGAPLPAPAPWSTPRGGLSSLFGCPAHSQGGRVCYCAWWVKLISHGGASSTG